MLKGPLCTLRHLVSADLNTFIALSNDLASRGEFFSSHFKSPEAIRKEFMLTGFVEEDRECFVIEDNCHHIIGTINHFSGRTPLCREIGYRLFDKELAGRGYISAATRLLVDHLFNTHQRFHRLVLLMDPLNLASERIAQKCGFTYEGTMRQAFFINGAIRDTKTYSLLRPEWQAAKA
ncbi:MAG TPA: ribosomal protein acetyltransferase [Janthinobacterium sp.]|nr:ribosomal protein acetyltransferase [Janthinobacterium sp.]